MDSENIKKLESMALKGDAGKDKVGDWWIRPNSADAPKLCLNNSISHSKVEFIPENPDSVGWYICGPTVYDVSHLGHARTFLTFDIVRRIMTDYFNYNIKMVMNITDVDDKIIIRSRERGMNFNDLARKYEKEFWEDMTALGVRMPHVCTRVTEYMPQIVDYIKKIVDNGFAYESNGSVYFDTEAFKKERRYGKLAPGQIGDEALLAEGEGKLGSSVGQQDKRSGSDFALWKKSKEGEPTWSSPWGEGRPGWHIECSAMASDILGQKLDIHAGGEDLKFPHHDNELAQSEAYYKSDQWVNYFIHAGHLNIMGLKMSKSLKNFTSIKECLKRHSPRQLRLLFLLHKYDVVMEYSDDTMDNAVRVDNDFRQFFQNIKSATRSVYKLTDDDRYKFLDASQSWSGDEKDLYKQLQEARQGVHAALCDNINTPRVMDILQKLMKNTNIYMSKHETDFRVLLVRAVGEYITEILRVMGVIPDGEIGFPAAVQGDSANAEDILAPYLDALTNFREKIRAASKEKDLKKVLEVCDEIRDQVLPYLGVRLEDKNNAPSVWKLEDKEVLIKEAQQKEAEIARKKAEREAKLKKELEKLEKAKRLPEDVFNDIKEEYSAFDDKGIPTHDKSGEPLAKNKRKGLEKTYNEQVKLHKWYQEKMAKEASTSKA